MRRLPNPHGGASVSLRENAPGFYVYAENAEGAGAGALLKAALAFVERLFQTERWRRRPWLMQRRQLRADVSL